jgi:tRNA pseudouridine55 synthase
MDGLVLARKPEGLTSHDVVARLRRILGVRRVGHFGTLDPFASGLLLVGVGKATRLFPFLSASDKIYEGRIRLGVVTDTYDRTGTPATSPPSSWPDLVSVRKAIDGFVGEIRQLPPPFSAKKHRGEPLYAFARRREEVERRPCLVKVHSFDLKSYAPPDLFFEVTCSAGTYIRSLAHDLGMSLGCGAHLAELIRTASGPYRLEDALSLEAIAALAEENRAGEAVLPLERLLLHFPWAVLTAEGLERIKNGRPVGPGEHSLSGPETVPMARPETSVVRLLSSEGRLVALARPLPGGVTLVPFVVLI